MCVASCVPCHASKGLRHGATTHDCSGGIGSTLRNSIICSNSHCETWACHTAIAAWPPECAMMSLVLRCVFFHLWLHPLVRPHYTCSCRTLISTMVSKSCPEVRFWGLLVLEFPHASKTCLLAALLTCVLVCARLVFACPSMYAHQHTARMATTSLD